MQGEDPLRDDLNAFAEIIRARRKSLGLSQEAVAAEAFGNPDRKSYLSALENKRRPRITVDTATKIAAALDIPIDDLPRSLRPEIISVRPLSDTAFQAGEIARAFNAQLREELSDSVLSSYQRAIAIGLTVLESWTGPVFGRQSLAVCVTLSLAYVVVAGLAAYGFGAIAPGGSAPFARPDWAGPIPSSFLALCILVSLAASGIVAYRLVTPDDRSQVISPKSVFRIVGGAVLCGAGCALAGLFGAEPIAVALTVALYAFAALSAWPLRVSAVAGFTGAAVAGTGIGIIDKDALPFDPISFIVFGGALGAASGAAASLVGGKISDRASAALTASGVGVGVGALGSGLVFALTPQLSGTQARAEELVVLMWLVLPVANALSDYVSLGISHFLARCVNHARSGWVQILSLVILDSVVAILLMAVTFLLIGWGLRLAETLFNIDYESTEFIARAAADPWRDGLWLTLMVLTTLFWTYVHLALVLAPVIAARIVGHLIERPLDTRIARRADEGKMEITAGAWLVLRHIAFACLVSAFALTPVWLVAALLDDFFAILI